MQRRAVPSEVSVMLTEAELQFHEAMLDIYRRAKAEADYNATRGYTALWERKRLGLTVEAPILQPAWQVLFSDAERSIAVNRLREYGYSASLPDVPSA
jgi:hypothetical protein